MILDDSSGSEDLWIVPLADGAEPRPYLQADYDERDLSISPDGTLAAYTSDETDDQDEVYVRGFPEPVGKWRISVGGGEFARWSPEGDELYFWRSPGRIDSLFAVPLQRDPEFVHAEPVFLLARNSWDVQPDGRFLLTQNVTATPAATDGEPAETGYLVVLNWFEELKARLGQRR